MLCCKHGFPWLSLFIHTYHSSLQAGLINYILCPYRAVVSSFGRPTQACQQLKGFIGPKFVHLCVVLEWLWPNGYPQGPDFVLYENWFGLSLKHKHFNVDLCGNLRSLEVVIIKVCWQHRFLWFSLTIHHSW